MRMMPLGLSMIFTAFFVMLGPVKLLVPFVQLTSDQALPEARKVALKAFGISCVGGVVAAFAGQQMLEGWAISRPALHSAAGLILLLVALKAVLAQYEPATERPRAAIAGGGLAFSPIAFPNILSPYGIAIFILLLAVTPGVAGDALILAMFLAVMVLNLAVMWFARPLMRRGGAAVLLLGAILGVLQVALGLQMLLDASAVLGDRR